MSKRKIRLRIGADPEFFLSKDASAGRVIVSAHDVIPGTKYEPVPVKKGAIQVDGVAAEFNIDPATSAKDFKNNIKTVLGELRDRVPDEYVFVFNPIAHFLKGYMNGLPALTKKLGCSPDYNAYTGLTNPTPDDEPPDRVSPWIIRSAAGHVHVGWEEGMDVRDDVLFQQARKVARQLDHVLLPGSIGFGSWWEENERRRLYGGPGSFRPKPYGMEYRSLSNAWLRYEESIEWVFNATVSAVDLLYNKVELEKIKEFRVARLISKDTADNKAYIDETFNTIGVPLPPRKLTELTYGS